MATEINIRTNTPSFSDIAARIKQGGHGDHHVRLSGDGTTLYVRPSAGGVRNFFTGIKDLFVGADRRQQGFAALRKAIETEYGEVGTRALASLHQDGRIRASDLESLHQTLEKEKALDIARQGLQRPAGPAHVNLVNSLTATEPDFLHVLIDLAEVHRQGNFFDEYSHGDTTAAVPGNTRAVLEGPIKSLPDDKLASLLNNIKQPAFAEFVAGEMADAYSHVYSDRLVQDIGIVVNEDAGAMEIAFLGAMSKTAMLQTMAVEIRNICMETAKARGVETSQYDQSFQEALEEEIASTQAQFDELCMQEEESLEIFRKNGGLGSDFPEDPKIKELKYHLLEKIVDLQTARQDISESNLKTEHCIELTKAIKYCALTGGDYMEAAVAARSGVDYKFDKTRIVAAPDEKLFGVIRGPKNDDDDVISTTADVPGYSRSADSAADINEESYADGVENQFRQDLEKLKSRPEFKEVTARIEELNGKIQKARENLNISEQHRAELISTYRGTRDDLFYKALGKAGI